MNLTQIKNIYATGSCKVKRKGVMEAAEQSLTSLSDGKGGVVVPDGGAGVGGPEAGVAPARRAVLQEEESHKSDERAHQSRAEGNKIRN